MNQIEKIIYLLKLSDEIKRENLISIYSCILTKIEDKFVKFNNDLIILSESGKGLLTLRGLYLVWIKNFEYEFKNSVATIEASKFYYGK